MGRISDTLWSTGRDVCQGLLHLLLPRVCWVCQRIQPLDQPAICDDCAAHLQYDSQPTCRRCAGTVGPFVDTAAGCSSCRDRPLTFDRAFRLGPYDGVLRDVLLRMKQSHGEGLAEVVGQFWAEQLAPLLEPLAPDVVVPIPLHWWRHRWRGFNQSEVLGRCLADRLRIPCQSAWLRSQRRTPPQKGLATAAKRWENIRGAFTVRPGVNLDGATVVLVDDILTTGATMSEAARRLRDLGPKSIVAAVVARDR